MVEITLFTDPACPVAFSAEPVRQRLRWLYADGLSWRLRMIVLTREEGEAEKLAAGAPNLQREYGMPLDPKPYTRSSSSEPACRAVVAARLNAPEAEEGLLRALRVRRMDGGLLDEPDLISAAAGDAGLGPDELARWSESDAVTEALEQDARAARSPTDAALALRDRLGGPEGEPRYSAPSYELSANGDSLSVVGINPSEMYEMAIANLDPSLRRRPDPESVTEVLGWFGEPLATAEVAEVCQIDLDDARKKLQSTAEARSAGADFYWTLP